MKAKMKQQDDMYQVSTSPAAPALHTTVPAFAFASSASSRACNAVLPAFARRPYTLASSTAHGKAAGPGRGWAPEDRVAAGQVSRITREGPPQRSGRRARGGAGGCVTNGSESCNMCCVRLSSFFSYF
jgi:hypothetical protein